MFAKEYSDTVLNKAAVVCADEVMKHLHTGTEACGLHVAQDTAKIFSRHTGWVQSKTVEEKKLIWPITQRLQHLRLNFLHRLVQEHHRIQKHIPTSCKKHIRVHHSLATHHAAHFCRDICLDGSAQLEHGIRLPLRWWAARHCRSAHVMAGQTCFCPRRQEIYISFAGSDMQAVAITAARRF